MDEKKKLLIKILTKLIPYRNLAEGILALMESSYADEKTIDGILLLMNQSITTVKNKKVKEKLQKGTELIKKIQQKENDEKDKENIEDLLDAI
ncbi:MAG: hypothetical protein ACD_80C00113G0003 [uncultured bacterium (gcode 4)]|uniref:Uncharacterized protein n=1 Tax=uncultured bacterium (gcode 4) TaxID=1234023 RepID=K1X4U1_9BACT|nr:MAG: hypothetical protein ACD_80C00113G0003 [uncultured bacterium (gcode 4)]HBB04256.1 hypothetical protein [Candidatus Gracilibacteria bacterium]